MYLVPFIILTRVFLGVSLPMIWLGGLEEDPYNPMENTQYLEEDPSYPVANIQEALSHLSPSLAPWLEGQEPNFKKAATQGTEKSEPLEIRRRRAVEEGERERKRRSFEEGERVRKRRSVAEEEKGRKRRSVEEGNFQQALCEVNERMFRPRAARRSVNLNDTQVSSS